MKNFRILLVLASFLMLALSAEAQWGSNPPHIYNTNSGNVGIGITTPSTLLHVAKNMTEPTITVHNLGGSGGATYSMIDNASGANWKFKAVMDGGFKIRDHASGYNVFTIAPQSMHDAIFIGSNGVIGFGTNTPYIKYGNKIDVKGDVSLEDANAWVEVNNSLANSNAGINFSEEGVYKGWLFYYGSGDYLRFSCDAGGWANHLVIHPTGELGIGTATTKAGYKLSVDGKVACEEVLVENSTNWPDHVFSDGYELMSLNQLEESIEKNNHLPGVPSATEVVENGFSLGEMQKIVLEKVEELTLYTIKQGKQIEELKRENEELRKLIKNK